MPKGQYQRKPKSKETRKIISDIVRKLWKKPKYREHMVNIAKESGRKPPSRRGMKMSESAKRAIGASPKWNKGKSCKHSGSFQPGEKHPNWKGGRSRDKHSLKDKRYKEWRLAIFNRDNFICLSCGKVGGDLEVHHIKSWANYPDLRYVISNGVTLCKACHKKTDSYSKKRVQGVERKEIVFSQKKIGGEK